MYRLNKDNNKANYKVSYNEADYIFKDFLRIIEGCMIIKKETYWYD